MIRFYEEIAIKAEAAVSCSLALRKQFLLESGTETEEVIQASDIVLHSVTLTRVAESGARPIVNAASGTEYYTFSESTIVVTMAALPSGENTLCIRGEYGGEAFDATIRLLADTASTATAPTTSGKVVFLNAYKSAAASSTDTSEIESDIDELQTVVAGHTTQLTEREKTELKKATDWLATHTSWGVDGSNNALKLSDFTGYDPRKNWWYTYFNYLEVALENADEPIEVAWDGTRMAIVQAVEDNDIYYGVIPSAMQAFKLQSNSSSVNDIFTFVNIGWKLFQ